MFIGELARRAGVSVSTLRYYERRALLPRPEKRESGYREYAPEAVRRVRFIRRAQQLGFTLQEIRGLLEVTSSESSSCSDIRLASEAKRADVHRRIRDLQRIERALDRLVQTCPQGAPLQECPLLDVLGRDGDDEDIQNG